MQYGAQVNWLDMNIDEIRAALPHEPAFRAKQLFQQLHKGVDIEKMTVLPAGLRNEMMRRPVGGATIIEQRHSMIDDTVKYLFALEDGNIVEGVHMHYHHGGTLCISTQVGCRMGCKFCASTIGSLVRNLSPGEMLGQILAVEKEYGFKKPRAVTNVVMMGSGEPLDNYENVTSFLRLVNVPDGINISLRNISLSTCGLVPRIRDLADSGLPVTLSLSLHAPDDGLRKTIMPIANKYPLSEVIDAVKYYVLKTGRRAIMEYALIQGVNDTFDCVRKLGALLKGFQCHVNLIPLNDVAETNLHGTSRKHAYEFANKLSASGLSATVRREMGADIDGACGQLRRGYINAKG